MFECRVEDLFQQKLRSSGYNFAPGASAHEVGAIDRLPMPGRITRRRGKWQRLKAERAGLLDKGESRQVIRLLEQEVRIGYWPHVEFDWTAAVRTAGELRAEHSLRLIVRSTDLFHVAIAIEVGAEALLSFDAEQIALAGATGLPVLNLVPKRL